ncbi:hypothetical protein ABK040_003971 [Willaertia magna]
MIQYIIQFFQWLLALIGLGNVANNNNQIPILEEEEEELNNNRRGVRSNDRRGVGNNNLRNRRQQQENNEEEEQDEEEEENLEELDENNNTINLTNNRLTKQEKINIKKMEKKRMKDAKKEYLQQSIQADKEKREKEKKRLENLQLKREEEEEREKEMEELQKLEKEKKSQEEYDEWRHLFEVEEQGEATDLSSNSGVLNEFINYIKDHKVVILEDLASVFKIKTEQVIKRIRSLEEEGLITGLLDDRGKFIYITEEEMEKVKQYILNEGRVTLTELRVACNQMISLKPKELLENELNIEEIVN